MISILNIWFLWAPCIILGAVSGFMSERVGVINIGINGIMVFGALFFCIFSNVLKDTAGFENLFLIIMLLSALCTTIIGVLFAFAAVKLKADNVVVGTAINLFSSGIGLIIAEFAPTLFQTTDIKNQCHRTWNISVGSEETPIYGSAIFAFIFAILVCLIIWFIMRFTKLGIRYRACGENPHAIYDQGVSVIRYQFLGIVAASFVAGLGGTYFGYDSTAFSGDVNGFGFLSLAVMIISAWKILPIIIIGAVFSFLVAYTRAAIISTHPYILRTLPYIAAIVAMAVFGKFVRPPACVGIPFDKGSR